MSVKSTTVRLMVQVGLNVAPAKVDDFAAKVFCTPRRGNRAKAGSPFPDGVGRHGTFKSGGNELAFWVAGSGPTVLLVHGWEGRAKQFKSFAEALLRSGHRVAALDLPAHGLSSGERTNVIDFARAIQDLATIVGPVKALVAHSLGGAAATLAQLEGHVAERLVLLAPVAEPSHYVNMAARWLGIPNERLPHVYRRIEEEVGRKFDAVDLRAQGGRIEVPLLVLHDPADGQVPFRHGEAVSKVSTRGELVSVPEVGHWRILIDPGVIAETVAFITGDVRLQAPRSLLLERALVSNTTVTPSAR